MRNRQPFTWFNIEGTVAETLSLVREFYDSLVDLYEEANETGETESPFYGWELKKEAVGAFVEFGLEGVGLFLYPRKVKRAYDIDDIAYQCGGQYYLATLEEVGGPPSYPEFMKLIKYLLSPLKDKVGWIDHSEVKDYCRGGTGYIVLTETVHRRQPLTNLMKEIGLVTPEHFLREQGYF